MVRNMTVRERVAELIALHLGKEMLGDNKHPLAELTLDLNRIQDDAVIFNVRVYGSDKVEGQVLVPVVTIDCEHLDQNQVNGEVENG